LSSAPLQTDQADEYLYETASGLDSDILDAVSDYRADSFLEINAWLRHGAHRSGIEDTVTLIDLGFHYQDPLEHSLAVYRGVRNKFAGQLVGSSPGESFEDLAFMSTSLERQVAEDFAGQFGAVLCLIVPPCHRVLYLPALFHDTVNREEFEVLLDRGQEFEVISVSDQTVSARLVQ